MALIEIEIVSPQVECIISVHREILVSKSEYFMKLLTGNFKESNQSKIRIKVSNGYVFIDLVNEFYGEHTNVGNISSGDHHLEMIMCKNYFGLPIIDLVRNLKNVETDNYDLLFQVADIINYCYHVKKAIFRNITKEYYSSLLDNIKNKLENNHYHQFIIHQGNYLEHYVIDNGQLELLDYFELDKFCIDFDLTDEFVSYRADNMIHYGNFFIKDIHSITIPTNIESYKLSRDMKKIFVYSMADRHIWIYDTESTHQMAGIIHRNSAPHVGHCYDKIIVSSNGKYLLVYGSSLNFYKLECGKIIWVLSSSSPVGIAIFSSNSEYILYNEGTEIFLDRTESDYKEMIPSFIFKESINALCFANNDQNIIIASDVIYVLDLDLKIINIITAKVTHIVSYGTKLIAYNGENMLLMDIFSQTASKLKNPANQSECWTHIKGFTIAEHYLVNPFIQINIGNLIRQ